jgi:hypothetical protein
MKLQAMGLKPKDKGTREQKTVLKAFASGPFSACRSKLQRHPYLAGATGAGATGAGTAQAASFFLACFA